MFTRAITRRPCARLAEGLTTAGLGLPSYPQACLQHAAYVETLGKLGLEVLEMAALDDYPDAHFVEDAAVVVPEVAVITIPGAPPRRGEQDSLEAVLRRYRETVRIEPPGTVDGGDVLVIGRQMFIGISGRTNGDGARQLGGLLGGHGYRWTAVPVQDGLHLKSEVNALDADTLLATERFAGLDAFTGFRRIVVDEHDAYAANSLSINGRVLVPKGFPNVYAALTDAGYDTVELDTSEMRKMDGGLTCLSLRF